jgi:nucleoside-diphosphate-sugar epimerase
MKVLVAGATGALGSQLVPRLVDAGHDVAGMTRSAAKGDAVRELGAAPVVADALVPDDGAVIGVMALDIADGQVQGVTSIVNPDKLTHLGAVADLRALLARRR